MKRALICILGLAFAGAALASDYSERPRLPDDMRPVALKAVDDLKAERYDAAAADYETIIARYPDSLYAWSNLGMVRQNQGEIDQAIRAFRQAARLQAGSFFVQLNLGFCLFEKKNYSAAIPPLERAEKLNSSDPNVHTFLARCYQEVGRDDEAREERQMAQLQQPGTYE